MKKRKGAVLYAVCKLLCRAVVFLFYRTKVLGKENIKKGLIVCNHFGLMDIPVVGVKMPFRLTAVGKKELFERRLAGAFLRRLGGVPIDRQNPGAAEMRTVIGILKDGKPMLMFPEGTRNRTGTDELQDIKGGAAMFALMSGADILPVRLWRKPRFFRRNILAVGKPLSFSGRCSRESMEAAEQALVASMEELKKLIDGTVAKKRKKKRKER